MKSPITTMLVVGASLGAAAFLWSRVAEQTGGVYPGGGGGGSWTVLKAAGIPVRFEDDKQFREVPSGANVVVALPSGWRAEVTEAIQVEFAGEGTADIQLRLQAGFLTGSVDLAVFTDKGGAAGKLRIAFVQGV